jgi:hypothetical protein
MVRKQNKEMDHHAQKQATVLCTTGGAHVTPWHPSQLQLPLDARLGVLEGILV